MSTYLIYARVSPRGSTWAASESSVPVQIDACRRHALALDPLATFVEVADEFQSGRDTNRPGWRRVLADLAHGTGDWDVLVVYSLDRCGRSIADMLPFFESLHKAGRGLLSVRQNIDMATAGGRAMLYMLCVFAQLEREMASERTLAKMMGIAAAGGIPYGKAPYGYRRGTAHDNILQPDPEPAAKVRQVFTAYAAGDPLGRITAATGLPKSSVMQILRRRIYVGVIEYGGHTFPGRHEPLVSQELWDRANARLPGPVGSGQPRPQSQTYPYLLAGLVKCHCGRAMTPYSVLKPAKRGKTRYHYYKCTDTSCRHAVSARTLDASILQHCRATPVGEDAARVLLERLTRQRLEAQRANVPRLAELSREIPKARARLDAAGEVFFSGRVTLDNAAHFNALLTEARMSLERLQAEERAILTEQAAELPDVRAVVDRLRYWGELLDRCDNDDTRRAFLQARVSQVTVHEDRSARLALVMTNEEGWQPRLELVITIAATAG